LKNRSFWLGFLIFLGTLWIDGQIFAGGSYALGILVCVGSILVFASGIVWLVYHDDKKIHFRRGWLVIPIAVFGYATVLVFDKSGITFAPAPENLLEIGNLVMTRFQIGMWIVSLTLLCVFVIAGSLIARRSA
jgi:hypothetical protein